MPRCIYEDRPSSLIKFMPEIIFIGSRGTYFWPPFYCLKSLRNHLKMSCESLNMRSIEDLADSILLHVFQYLDHVDVRLGVRLTCKRWHQLSYDFSLWRVVNFSNQHDLTDQELMSVLDGCSHVVSIDVENCSELSDASLVCLGRSCPNLEKLVISGTKISDGALLFIAKKCPKIKTLAMCNCVNITSNSQAALYRLSELKSLTVSENLDRIAEDDSDDGKIALSNLEEFVLQKSASFYLSDDWMMVLCERLSKLRKLACSGFTVLDDECIVRFAESCPNLSTVILNITMIGDKTLTALGGNCRLLEHLNVSCCHNVTDVGLCNIAMNCQKLRHLDVSGSQPDEDEHQTSSHIQGNATDVAVQHFAVHCPQLTYLNVSSCPGITDLGLVAVAEHCPQLQHLEMTNCIAITDNTLCSVAKHCRHFCHLQASECVQLTSKGVNSLVRMCPSLQIVQLETCHHIAQLNFDPRFQESELVISGRHHTHNDDTETSSSKGMVSYCNELAEQDDSDCISVERTETKMSTSPALSNAITDKALKHLNLSCCSKIANGDLKQIASHCPYLQFISLYGCHRITDKGMEILVKRCQHLEYLNIECLRTYRSKLTDLTLVDIADHCCNLQYLNIRGGLQFSKEHIRSVVNACCKLRELRCTMEVKGDVYQYMFLPREPYKAELEGQLTWSQKFHPRYGNPVKQCHLNFKFRPITASGR